MKRALFLACLVIAGCRADDHVVTRPHITDAPPAVHEKTPAAASAKPLTKSQVEMLEAGDLSLYAVPMYPGATLDDKAGGGLKSKGADGQEITVSMSTVDTIGKVLKFYRANLTKLTTGVARSDFAFLEGSSPTGNAVQVVIGKLPDTPTSIVVTVRIPNAK